MSQTAIRDRIIRFDRVPAKSLRDNPANWRRHSPEQLAAIASILERIGFAGAVLTRETPKGLELIDGHARKKLMLQYRGLLVPVLVTDLDPGEALTVLATYDPLGAMAETDTAALASLLQTVTDSNAPIEAVLTRIGQDLLEPFPVVNTLLAKLKPHPLNYRTHPEDQIQEIMASITSVGLYRNIITAADWTILAGHAATEAAGRLGRKTVPVVRLDLDPYDPRALRILAGDNEISSLGMVDDRKLSDMLKLILDSTGDIAGTGFSQEQLAALVMTTRTAAEIASKKDAAEWVGMPEYQADPNDKTVLLIRFESPEDRAIFLQQTGVRVVTKNTNNAWSGIWPDRPDNDFASVHFQQAQAS